jgi:Tfp pilus assembly protein PilZ
MFLNTGNIYVPHDSMFLNTGNIYVPHDSMFLNTGNIYVPHDKVCSSTLATDTFLMIRYVPQHWQQIRSS